MALFETIQKDIKEAMVARDANKLGVLRFLSAQIHNFGIEKKAKTQSGQLTDEDVLGVIRRESKKRKESIQMFKDGGRKDLAEKEEAELKVLEEYLPQGPTEEQIAAAVDKVLLSGKNDFGGVMKEVVAVFQGQADGKVVSEIVKKKIGK